MFELVFYGAIAFVAALVWLGRYAERRENTRAKLLTASGDPAWAHAHGLSSGEGSQRWTGQASPVPDGDLRVSLMLDREASGRRARLVSLEATLTMPAIRPLAFSLESSLRPSGARGGHPTLARWYVVEGEAQEVIASVNASFADSLVALRQDEPAWASVRARGHTLTCIYEGQGATEEELEGLLDGMLGRVRAVARAWPRPGDLTARLDTILRDPSEPDAVRWRAVMHLLTRHADSDFARAAFEDRESWPDPARAACLIWGGEAREFSPEERYVLWRDASRDPDADLARAASRELARRAPWRGLLDARVGLDARLMCAPEALSDPDLPGRERDVDDALVGLLTGMLPEEPARVRLYEVLTGAGWSPAGAARVKLVERGTPALNAAIMARVEAVGATAEDTQALEALRAEGFSARVDAAFERARARGGEDGRLTLTEGHDQGALTPAQAEGGELTPADET
jgi:hypothetical protein